MTSITRPLFYLCLLYIIYLASPQGGLRGNRGNGGNEGGNGNGGNRGNGGGNGRPQNPRGPIGRPPVVPIVLPEPIETNPVDVIEAIVTEHPGTDVFATESALEAEVKSGVVIQIFDNSTSFEDIKQAHETWAGEAGVEFEFVVGDLNLEYVVEEDDQGNLNVIITVGEPTNENEAIIVNTEATESSTGGMDLTTSSIDIQNDTENVVVAISEPEPGCPTCTEPTFTAAVLGGGGSNCQDVVTCQWVNIPRVGVKKVCKTKLVCS